MAGTELRREKANMAAGYIHYTKALPFLSREEKHFGMRDDNQVSLLSWVFWVHRQSSDVEDSEPNAYCTVLICLHLPARKRSKDHHSSFQDSFALFSLGNTHLWLPVTKGKGLVKRTSVC